MSKARFAGIVGVVALAGCTVQTAPVPSAQSTTTTNQTATNFKSSFSYTKTTVSGASLKLGFFTDNNADCSSKGNTVVRILTQPKNGSVMVVDGADFPTYPKDSQRYPCNLQKVPGILVYYKSNPDFVGTDGAKVEAIFPAGQDWTTEYAIDVK